MSILGNVFGHSKSTLKGLAVGVGSGLTAGVGAAAMEYKRTGNVSSWQPYALAAFAAAVPAIVGAFSKDEKPAMSEPAQKAATAIEQAGRDYASIKADEVIANLQKQLGSQP